MTAVFTKLGISPTPVILAPLAGVSDHPFRRICTRLGADLTYVEMLSATALLRHSERTLNMMERHPNERILGVQITGSSPTDISNAIAKLDTYNFDTIDINMGCPVRKVVNTGCGSALLRDAKNVFEVVRLSRQATKKPLSVKIRLGWDRNSMNAVEVALAAQEGGADWLTVHGRCRSDDYQTPVDLNFIQKLSKALTIPVIGNGNLFGMDDVKYMHERTGVSGTMISRGALGNPWVFMQAKKPEFIAPTVEDWFAVVSQHLAWQREAYQDKPMGALCMRKHLLWYTKGFVGSKKVREKINTLHTIDEIQILLGEFADSLLKSGVTRRDTGLFDQGEGRFAWDPKWDMDREHDRGVNE